MPRANGGKIGNPLQWQQTSYTGLWKDDCKATVSLDPKGNLGVDGKMHSTAQFAKVIEVELGTGSGFEQFPDSAQCQVIVRLTDRSAQREVEPGKKFGS